MAISDYLKKGVQTGYKAPVKTSSAVSTPTVQAKPQAKWYSGAQPTARETGAQVYRVGMQDPSQQAELNSLFEAELDNPSGPIYQPYRKATSTSFTKTNVQNTQKAQAEWAGLQDELSYWAGRSDLNLSDDEIIGRIDWKKYSTLAKMDKQAAMGTPLALVDAVGYSKDAMYGILWAARNPGQSTGDALYDSIQGQLGRGNQFKANNVNGWRDATSDSYAPYKAGATALGDLAYKYGMDGDYDMEWLNSQQGLVLLNGDEQMRKDYNRIYEVVTQTDKIDEELQRYHAEVNSAIAAGMDPSVVFDADKMAKDYPELWKAYEGQRSGKLTETSRALDFDFNADVLAVQDAYMKKTGTMDDADFAADVSALLGVPTMGNEAQKAVTVQTNAQLQEAGSIFAKWFTTSEAGAMYTADAGYAPTKQQLAYSILHGTAGENEAYASAMDAANAYAVEFWLNSVNTLNRLKAEKEAIEKYAAFDQKWAEKLGADPFNAQFDPEYIAENEAIQPYLSVAEKYGFDAAQIDAAIANEEKVQANILQRFADAEKYNTTGMAGKSAMPLLTFVSEFGGYEGGQRYANTAWGKELSNGVSWEKVSADINQQEKNNIQLLRMINTALRQAGEYGLNADYTKGLMAFRDELLSETKLIQYDKLRGNADFEATVKNFSVPSSTNPILMVMDDPDTFYRTADEQTLAYGAPVSRMTDGEKALYKYVYATQGAEAAADYYSMLEPMLNVRMSEEAEAQAKEDADSAWFGGTVASALMNLGGVAGMFDSALKTISGQEVDPYGMSFLGQRYSQTLREEVKKNIDETGGAWADVLKLGYDVLATSLDQGAALAAGGGTPFLTLALQSGSAGNAALMDAYLMGGNDLQAWGKAGVATLAEYLTERGPLGDLFDAFANGGTGVFKDVLKRRMLAEGLGEGITEIVNTVSDNVIMQELSQYNALVEQYMAEGYTEEIAQRMADWDTFTNIMYSGFLGSVSAAPTTAASYAAGTLANRKQNKFKSRAEAALSKAQSDGAGKPAQAAAMAAAMETGGSAPEDADAAASAMVQTDPQATYTLWSILDHSTDFDAIPAVELGALVPDSQTGNLFAMIKEEGATDENVAQLIETAQQEMSDPAVKARYDAAIASYAEGMATMTAMVGADLSGIKNAQRNAENASRTLQTARTSLENARASMKSASTVLQNAQKRFSNDHGDKATAAVIKAKERYQKAQQTLEGAKQTEENARKDYDAAKVELETMKQNTLAEIRQQGVTARDQIMANRQAVQEQKAAEAEAKREADNALSLEADNFVNTYFDTAPEDVKKDIKERYLSYDGETRKVTRDMSSFASQISKKFNLSIKFTDSHSIFEGAYTGGNQIVLDKNATQGDVIKRVLVHEITHAAETSNVYNELADAVLEAYYGDNKKQIEVDIEAKSKQYAEAAGQDGAAIARTELVAERLAEMLTGNQEAMDRLVAEKPAVATRIWRAIKEFIGKMTGVQNSELDKFIQLEKKLEKALSNRTVSGNTERYALGDVKIPDSSDSGEPAAEIIRGGVTKFSLTSWSAKEKETVRSNLVQNGYDPDSVDKWISDVNSVAAIIAADKDRLDYNAADNQVMLKDNDEYIKTLDASTLCAKRLLYQGTFNAIQHELPNTVLTSEDLLHLSDMMNQAGLETPCGVCYVESRRRHLGKYAQEWLDSYDGEYKPTLDEVTTTDGLEALRHSHPKVYQDFVDNMNSKGSNNPKVVQLRTDYRGDIRDISKSDEKKIVKIGGLRVQSFSDFETPHLIDMMQAVLDMSSKKLTSQAYTKVPNFAWVFGDTGIKINLSLLAEGNGLNEDGTLRFSSKEGMDIDEAMRLRERYSENVGTILVGVSEEHIRAAMADPRIDYIIPFHKSGWGQNELKMLPVLNSYDDFTTYQKERKIIGYFKNGKPKYQSPSAKAGWSNFYPIDYWDYDKSGDENAAIYLRMCEEDGRVPKFEQFLEKDSEGHWVAPSGYWKMLIDFKMYDNDGKGAPQKSVQPNFNMEEAVRVLKEYEGGADSLPVAYDIVDRFVAEKKAAAAPGTRFSLPSTDIITRQMAAYRESQQMDIPEGMGQRQFAGQTVQNSSAVPEEYKPTFMMPENLFYEKDTNREQVERAWQRIQQNGFEAEYNRLLEKEEVYDADDTAEANLMMAMALNPNTSDPAVFMSLALRYNEKGTENAQALQARQLFKKMTPTGAQVWVAGKAEKDLKERRRTHQPEAKMVDDAAQAVADSIKDKQGGDELLRLTSGGDFTIDASNNKWGIPLNEQQKALIDQYDLNDVNRPGLFYNRATVKQRMLEAIIATPNPLEVTGLGLNLIQRLEYMKRGDAVVTNADLNYIGARLGEFIGAGEEAGGRIADLALARAYEAYANINPASAMEKFRAQRYVNMLLSVPSFLRNIIGNVGQNAMNAAAHGVAVEVDKLMAKKTGVRTLDHLTVEERRAGWEAFVEETKNTFNDFFVDKVNTAPNRDKYSTNNRGRVFQNGIQEGMRNMENFLMSVGDRNVWKKAYVNSLAEQQRLADQGLLFNPDGTTMTHEQMVEQAEHDANYATFNEDTIVQEMMGALAAKHPAIADLISVYLPFTGVPTNIIKRSLQFSPMGFAKVATNMVVNQVTGRNVDQKGMANDIGRALTGTGMLAAGILLGMLGVIKMGTEDESSEKAYDAATAIGQQYTPYVFDPITGTNVSMSTFAPALSPLVWGAAAWDALDGDEDAGNALLNALFYSTDSIFNASYLSGLSDLFGGYGSFTERLFETGASNVASQLVPAWSTQLANALDPYVRNTKDKNHLVEVMNNTINKIPFLRTMLPEKVTVAGENVYTKGWWGFVDPYTRTDPSKSAAMNESYRLYDLTGDTGVLPSDLLRGRKNTLNVGDKRTLTLENKDKEWYQKRYGEIWTTALMELMRSPKYARMDEDERAEALKKILSDAMSKAKKEAWEKYGEE